MGEPWIWQGEVRGQVRCPTADATVGPALKARRLGVVHWDWVCDVLRPTLAFLEFFTTQQIDETNRMLATRAPTTR